MGFPGEVQGCAAESDDVPITTTQAPVASDETASRMTPGTQMIPLWLQRLQRRERLPPPGWYFCRKVGLLPGTLVKLIILVGLLRGAGLEQQHAGTRLGQRPGRRTASRARTDDNGVVLHRHSL